MQHYNVCVSTGTVAYPWFMAVPHAIVARVFVHHLEALASTVSTRTASPSGQLSGARSRSPGLKDTPPCKIHSVYVWATLQGEACV